MMSRTRFFAGQPDGQNATSSRRNQCFCSHGMRRSRTITFQCPARIADLFPNPKLSEGGDMRDCVVPVHISKLCRSSVIESHDLTVGCLAGNDIPQTLVPAFSEGDTEGSCTNPPARRTLRGDVLSSAARSKNGSTGEGQPRGRRSQYESTQRMY